MSVYTARAVLNLVNERNHNYNAAVSWQAKSNALEAELNKVRAEKGDLEKQLSSLQENSIYFKDSLHPTIREKCVPHLEDGHYDDAIRNAYLAVEVAVRAQARAPATMIGVDLMSYAFKGENPPLPLAAVQTEQDGIHLLFMGAIKTFRNPFGHRFVNETEHSNAVETLAFASRLLKMLDAACPSTEPIQPASLNLIFR